MKKTKRTKVELNLRDLIKRFWVGWVDWIEPRGNAGIGHPDCELLIDGNIIPLELKLGEVNLNHFGGDLLVTFNELRPVQYSWHHTFWQAGGKSFFLIQDNRTKFIWIADKIINHKDYKHFQFENLCFIGDFEKLTKEKFTSHIKEFISATR